jgi:hypothetical protein
VKEFPGEASVVCPNPQLDPLHLIQHFRTASDPGSLDLLPTTTDNPVKASSEADGPHATQKGFAGKIDKRSPPLQNGRLVRWFGFSKDAYLSRSKMF